jgi:hypothetical protein
MRLVGIDEELAAEHDDELMIITDIHRLTDSQNETQEVRPPDATLH